MNSTERLKGSKYLYQEKAFKMATELQAAGCTNVFLQQHWRGWMVNPGGHADMVAVAKVCSDNGCGILYRPFGGEGWPDVMIYDLEKAGVG